MVLLYIKLLRNDVLKNYEIDYAKLLKKDNTTTLEIERLRTLVIEILKESITLIQVSWKTYLPLKDILKINPYDVLVKHHKSAKYGGKSSIALGPKIGNQLPSKVKYF